MSRIVLTTQHPCNRPQRYKCLAGSKTCTTLANHDELDALRETQWAHRLTLSSLRPRPLDLGHNSNIRSALMPFCPKTIGWFTPIRLHILQGPLPATASPATSQPFQLSAASPQLWRRLRLHVGKTFIFGLIWITVCGVWKGYTSHVVNFTSFFFNALGNTGHPNRLIFCGFVRKSCRL